MKLLAAWLTVLALSLPRMAAADTVRLLIPDRDNLQYLAFWVAKGAGYFAEEGLDIALSIPSAPGQTTDYFRRNDSDVAVLPPPMYLELIGARFPVLLVANLLANDPIDLVVRSSVAKRIGVTKDQPMAERLAHLKGLRMGVAPHPVTRLRALFSSYGMNADRDLEIVTLPGPQQNYAFAEERVDALFCHTPYLETSLVDQGAEVIVNLSAGEVPSLATRQIHALVVTRAFAARYPSTTERLTRAVARAEKLIHKDTAGTVAAILNEFRTMDPRKVQTLVEIYTPAVPATPRVSKDGILPALAFFPANKPPPSLEGIDLDEYVAPDFAEEASRRMPRKLLVLALTSAAFLLAAILVAIAWWNRRGVASKSA